MRPSGKIPGGGIAFRSVIPNVSGRPYPPHGVRVRNPVLRMLLLMGLQRMISRFLGAPGIGWPTTDDTSSETSPRIPGQDPSLSYSGLQDAFLGHSG